MNAIIKVNFSRAISRLFSLAVFRAVPQLTERLEEATCVQALLGRGKCESEATWDELASKASRWFVCRSYATFHAAVYESILAYLLASINYK